MVKILHTSDWHLGRWLYTFRRDDEFTSFLGWLKQLIADRQVDYLLVAGDVFDTGTPSATAQKMYYRFLAGLQNTSCKGAVIIAGNHDSSSFLAAPKELLKALNIRVVSAAATDENIEDEIVVFRNDTQQPELVVAAVPFLKERNLRTMTPGETYEQRLQKMAAGMRRHYRTIYETARQAAISGVPLVAMGHLFAAGGRTSSDDGVRDLSVGSLGVVNAADLDIGFDYVALGHLHIAQTAGGRENIRYCGSPLPIGFGEAEDIKQVILVETSIENIPLKITPIPVPVFKKLYQIRGSWEEIKEQIEKLKALDENIFVEIFYQGETFFSGLGAKIDELVRDTRLEVCRIHNRERENYQAVQTDGEELEDVGAEEMFERCLEANRVDETERQQLRDLYRQVLIAVENSDAEN